MLSRWADECQAGSPDQLLDCHLGPFVLDSDIDKVVCSITAEISDLRE